MLRLATLVLSLAFGLGGCRAEGPNLPCADGECTCDSGATIDRDYLCDWEDDCGDWQDEEGCPGRPRLACDGDECTCDAGEIIRRDYICDGVEDCGDAQDEKGCSEIHQPEKPLMGCWSCPPFGSNCDFYLAPRCTF